MAAPQVVALFRSMNFPNQKAGEELRGFVTDATGFQI
jgi:hypothetical protein